MFAPPESEEIDVTTLAQYLARPDREMLQFIDVREPHEVAIAALEGFDVFPLSEFEEWYNRILVELNPHHETIVLCHHGIRSAQMCAWLKRQGFTQVKNVAGGIDAYAQKVDPTLQRY